MKIANILFNYKKSTNEKKTLGVERCFIDYAKYLIANGNELISITKPNMVFASDVEKTGSKLFELKATNKVDIISMLRLGLEFFSFKPDAVICHSGRALFFARVARFLVRKKFPIIGIDHGVNPKKFLKADYVLTVNSYFSQQLVRAGKLQDRALVIPNMMEIPPNFTELVKKPFRKSLKIGSLGRLYWEKYFDKVLLAMAILRDRGIESEYVIGGVGPMEKPLKDLAQELKLENNFKILGWVEDKPNFFDSIDIFILPSCYETFGIVLLEAMLYSTPIITSNSWGPDEVIDHEVNGLKVSKDDEKEMPKLIADAIENLVKDEDFAKKLAIKAKEKFFTNYSSEVVAKKLNEIIKMAVRESATNAK
jgi:glycosyltransferase involved in cell wall biosynthesis